MTEPLAFLNGRLLPQSGASLALNDAGFVFGATVTDLCRTFRHRLYRWFDHLTRFRRSCESAYVGLAWSDEEITRRAHELIAHNAALINARHDLALVLFATPGPIGYYLSQSGNAGDTPTFGMHTFPLPFARLRPWIEQGVYLRTPSVRAMPGTCVDPHIKQRSRMHWWLAEKEINPSPPAPLPHGARGAQAPPAPLPHGARGAQAPPAPLPHGARGAQAPQPLSRTGRGEHRPPQPLSRTGRAERLPRRCFWTWKETSPRRRRRTSCSSRMARSFRRIVRACSKASA